MSHSQPGHHYEEDLEALMESLPDEVSAALMAWRIARLEREKTEALLLAKYRGLNTEATATEIKGLVHSDPSRYDAVLNEIKAEAEYTLKYERLLSAKKRAGLRTAF